MDLAEWTVSLRVSWEGSSFHMKEGGFVVWFSMGNNSHQLSRFCEPMSQSLWWLLAEVERHEAQKTNLRKRYNVSPVEPLVPITPVT